MDLPRLPSEIWDRILKLVVNSEDSNLSHLILANIIQREGHYFKLNSLEFQGTDNSREVLISLNGRTPLLVRSDDITSTVDLLASYLPRTSRIVYKNCNQNSAWMEAFDCLSYLNSKASIVLDDCDLGNTIIDRVCESEAESVLITNCTSSTGFTHKSSCSVRRLFLIGCSAAFACRIVLRCLLHGSSVEHFRYEGPNQSIDSDDEVVFEAHSKLMNSIRCYERSAFRNRDCWRTLFKCLARKCPDNVQINFTDSVVSQAELLEALVLQKMILENEYYSAFEQLTMHESAVLTFHKSETTHSIFVNGEPCRRTNRCDAA